MRIPALIASVALITGVLVGASASAQAAPVVDDCVDLPVGGDPFDPYTGGTVVDCEAPHNGEIYGVADYPADWGAPSTEEERIRDFAWQESVCSFQALDEWLTSDGAPLPMIPTRIYNKAAVPSDAEWEAGDRTVRCIAYALTGPYGREKLSVWTGTIPTKMTTSEGVKFFAYCSKAKPVSGSSKNSPYECRSAKQWVGVGFVGLKGKPGAKFPGPKLQKSADKQCVTASKGFITGKVKPLGVVVSKSLWDRGVKEAICYIPLGNWNGKAV